MNLSVVLTFLFAILSEMFFPVILILIARKKFKTSLNVFMFGALMFILAEALRIPLLLLLTFLSKRVEFFEGFSRLQILLLNSTILALTAGIFEEGARYFGYKKFIKERNFSNGVSFGIGHSGVESVIVGILVSLSLINYIYLSTVPLESLPIPEEKFSDVEKLLNVKWYEPLIGALERIFAISFHLGMSVLVLQCFLKNKKIYLFIAIFFHFLLDFPIGILPNYMSIYYLEVWAFLGALFGLFLVFRYRDL
ncbi:MAG: YhfC family glutamic-type intramembrane protease [Candidatus Methanofastidiosia archaeon]